MKTVTHKGKVYQIGGLYEFSDDGERWYHAILSRIDEGSDFFFINHGEVAWRYIRHNQTPIGTIEDAPIELEDGCPYQFNHRGSNYMGVYCKKMLLALYPVDSVRPLYVDIKNCTDIVKLVPEVKEVDKNNKEKKYSNLLLDPRPNKTVTFVAGEDIKPGDLVSIKNNPSDKFTHFKLSSGNFMTIIDGEIAIEERCKYQFTFKDFELKGIYDHDNLGFKLYDGAVIPLDKCSKIKPFEDDE